MYLTKYVIESLWIRLRDINCAVAPKIMVLKYLNGFHHESYKNPYQELSMGILPPSTVIFLVWGMTTSLINALGMKNLNIYRWLGITSTLALGSISELIFCTATSSFVITYCGKTLRWRFYVLIVILILSQGDYLMRVGYHRQYKFVPMNKPQWHLHIVGSLSFIISSPTHVPSVPQPLL